MTLNGAEEPLAMKLKVQASIGYVSTVREDHIAQEAW